MRHITRTEGTLKDAEKRAKEYGAIPVLSPGPTKNYMGRGYFLVFSPYHTGKGGSNGFIDVWVDENAFIPASANAYDNIEKVGAFDRLHAHAMDNWNELSKVNGRGRDDCDHYAYEAIMELLAGPGGKIKDFWDAHNKLPGVI